LLEEVQRHLNGRDAVMLQPALRVRDRRSGHSVRADFSFLFQPVECLEDLFQLQERERRIMKLEDI